MQETDLQSALQRFLRLLHYNDVVLTLTGTDYTTTVGGTEKIAREEQMELFDRKISTIQCSIHKQLERSVYENDPAPLITVNVDIQPAGAFTSVFFSTLIRLLAASGRVRFLGVHMHHLMRWPLPAVEDIILAAQPKVKRLFVHDFYSACPQYNLLHNDEDYCGGGPDPAAPECKTCKHGTVRRAHMEAFRRLAGMDEMQIIFPSKSTSDIWGKSFPEFKKKGRIVPYQKNKEFSADESARIVRLNDPEYSPKIAYLGYQSYNKGWPAWERIVTTPKLQNFYEFLVLGACSTKLPQVTEVQVSFQKSGMNAMVEALLENEIDMAFIWSVWPETYCYTCFEAFAANCFVLSCSLSGNVADRLADGKRGRVFSDERELHDFLVDKDAVKTLLKEALQNNPRLELIRNTQIAQETANLTNGTPDGPLPTADEIIAQAEKQSLITLLEHELHRSVLILRDLDNVDELKSKIERLNEIHLIKDEGIAKLAGEITGLNTRVKELDEHHVEKDKQIKVLDEARGNLIREITQLQQEVERLNDFHTLKDKEIIRLQEVEQNLHREVARLNEHHALKDKGIEALKQEIVKIQQDKERELHAVFNSMSYKLGRVLTAPWRRVKQLVRG